MKPIPFEFVLDALARAHPYTNPMFGCTAVYVGDKIVLILRNRESAPRDNGIWIATTKDHHESLKKDFPMMRSIEVFGTDGPTGWQNLPAEDPGFEDAALKACELILRQDPRIGKVPKPKSKKRKR